MDIKDLYMIRRPSMEGTQTPTYNYTFANTIKEAISKVRFKYGECDEDIICRKLTTKELDKLIIGTDYFG